MSRGVLLHTLQANADLKNEEPVGRNAGGRFLMRYDRVASTAMVPIAATEAGSRARAANQLT
jgi:hypothetical protein